MQTNPQSNAIQCNPMKWNKMKLSWLVLSHLLRLFVYLFACLLFCGGERCPVYEYIRQDGLRYMNLSLLLILALDLLSRVKSFAENKRERLQEDGERWRRRWWGGTATGHRQLQTAQSASTPLQTTSHNAFWWFDTPSCHIPLVSSQQPQTSRFNEASIVADWRGATWTTSQAEKQKRKKANRNDN